MNVSEQLLDILTNEGVKNIFGIAGDALNPLINALGKQDKIEWVSVNHEGNASFAAFAQGALGKNFGVCASTVGPGALHLVNGLYNAKKEKAPVIAITGQVPTQHIGTNYHQEVNLTKVFEDICEYQAIIRTPEEAPKVILRAINIAINKKAVCRIELPADVAEMKAVNQKFVHKVYRSESVLIPSENQLNQVSHLINNHDNIGILAGAGCRNAKSEVLKLSKKIAAPITHTVRSADIFDHETENVVGLTGLIGNKSGYEGVMNCDVLLMIGTNFPYIDFLPTNTKIVQIDINTDAIGNRVAIDCGLHGHIKPTLELLIDKVNKKTNQDFLNNLNSKFKNWKESNKQKSDVDRNMEPLHPPIIARAISELASDDAIFVVDTGTSTIWSTNFMNFNSKRRVIGSFNHGSMAVGLPAAIGAQLMYPNREVWALIGDGAFNMSLQDFKTAVKLNLPINIIVFNNEELGFVKIEMEEAGLAPNFDALKLDNIPFHEYANLCGGDGIHLSKPENIYASINKAKSNKLPTLINADVTSGELALPPKIGWEEVKGFGTSKVKELIKAVSGDKEQWNNIKAEVEAYFN